MSKNTNIADLINYISVDGSGNVVLTTGGQVATQSYVTTAVSNLVNAAPSTLDTLKELATALGNDANFATTVTNSIATKLPLSGGTLTGALTGTSATFSGDLTIAKGSPLTIYNRTATNEFSGLQFKTSGTNNFGLGLAWNGASTDFEIYNYSTSSTALKLNYSNNAATFSSKISVRGGTDQGGYYMDYQSDAASRSFRVSSENLVFGDFVIQRSTTRTGTTYENLLYFDASRAATFSSSVSATQGTFTSNDTFAQDSSGQIVIRGASNTAKRLGIGFDTTNNYAYLQAIEAGVATRPLVLQPFGGNVGIGTISPNAVATGARVLQVDGSAYGFILASSGSVIGQFAGNSGGIVTFGARSNHDVTFTTNDVERMRLTAIGPGTIGCLLVNKTTASTSYPIQTQSANGAYMASANGPGDANFYSTSPTIGYHIYGDQGGAAKFNVTGAGKGYFAAGVQFGNGSGTLNYYEEGNWTPQLVAGGTPFQMGGINAGKYIRIGNQVTVTGHLQWSGGSASGMVSINGLPFTSSGVRTAGSIGAVGSGISFNSGYGQWILVNDPSTSFIYIIQQESDGSGYSHTPPVSSSGVIYGFSITYFLL